MTETQPRPVPIFLKENGILKTDLGGEPVPSPFCVPWERVRSKPLRRKGAGTDRNAALESRSYILRLINCVDQKVSNICLNVSPLFSSNTQVVYWGPFLSSPFTGAGLCKAGLLAANAEGPFILQWARGKKEPGLFQLPLSPFTAWCSSAL